VSTTDGKLAIDNAEYEDIEQKSISESSDDNKYTEVFICSFELLNIKLGNLKIKPYLGIISYFKCFQIIPLWVHWSSNIRFRTYAIVYF
jgi:hypothetical protein